MLRCSSIRADGHLGVSPRASPGCRRQVFNSPDAATVPIWILRRNVLHEDRFVLGGFAMIYILAIFVPPLALLLNGQLFSAILNLVLIVPCIVFGLVFPVLFLLPSAHAVLAVYMKREDRKHREIVDAIERHGPPPNYRP
jgi:hypothetical protein